MGKFREQVMVSVMVVTYNSSDFVVDTLDSIKTQTYDCIELVITDDCSTDDTLDLVKKWVDINKSRFCACKIIESDKNTGITENINRGIENSQGEYLKPIAGDDLLLANCIEDLLSYTLANDLNFAYSKALVFSVDGHSGNLRNIAFFQNKMSEFFSFDHRKQYIELLKSFPIYTIGLFLKTQFINDLGRFDTRYKMLEDYPFAVKVASMGYRLNLLNEFAVKYRLRAPNRNSGFRQSKRKTVHEQNRRAFERDEIFPRLLKERMYFAIFDLFVRRLAEDIDSMGNSQVFSVISKVVGYLSPSKIKTRWEMVKFFKGIR